jgi:hypothetical protein
MVRSAEDEVDSQKMSTCETMKMSTNDKSQAQKAVKHPSPAVSLPNTIPSRMNPIYRDHHRLRITRYVPKVGVEASSDRDRAHHVLSKVPFPCQPPSMPPPSPANLSTRHLWTRRLGAMMRTCM